MFYEYFRTVNVTKIEIQTNDRTAPVINKKLLTMPLRTILLAVFTLLLAFLTGCGSPDTPDKEQKVEITNPVLPGDRPDPTVVKVGDTYWASATSSSDSRRSPKDTSN